MSKTIFLEKIKSEGLAHLSYIIGHGGKAAVIDPRRDCECYRHIAYQNGAQITHIFETHRNEDYVVGSTELARLTDANIYHGKNLDFSYGHPLSEGDTFEFGDIRLSILETPGHTYESISIVMYDMSSAEKAIAVFTGDVLFIGAVGRTDFFPEHARETAGMQYDSIFEKILPLGDQVILYPGHGAGSVCGSGMANREISTLGYERQFNPDMQVKDREAFIEKKINEKLHIPPYFKKMEEYNQHGSAPPINGQLRPKPIGLDSFTTGIDNGMISVDLRSPEAFSGAFIPGSLAIPLEMIPAYAGYFLPYDKQLGLVTENYEDAQQGVRLLIRLGYDNIAGYLAEGIHGWETAGKKYGRIPAVHAEELSRRYRENENFTVLDVREKEELELTGKLPGAVHVFLGDLPDRLDEIDRDKLITTFCGSGKRAIIAASILKQNGFDRVEDSLGSMEACKSMGCPLEK